jgi:photosystem II stability/assembly factor-like uncharacterized protein
MKKVVLLLFCFTLGLTSFAQQDESVFDIMERTDITLQEAQQRANAIFDRIGTGRGTGYKHFQRWLYERKFHIDENGRYFTPQEEWNRYNINTQNNFGTAGNWTEQGPVTWNRTSSWNPGTGRISAMAINPANENIIYVGSPGGGIWKTTNGGGTWAPLQDYVNSSWMSYFAITIDPNNQDIVYAGMSGSAGIIKSTNGGATWTSIGTMFGGTVRKIVIHPSNSNIVFVASSNGIWRSINGGTSFVQVHTIGKEDIEFKPNDVNTMYATGNDVWRSTDYGITWTQVTAAQGITNTGRTLVGVSAANPNYVYICQASGSSFGRMYKSTDAGLSFVTTVVGNPASGTNYFGYETNGTGTGGQATYDMALDVSPTNASEVYIAGIICWKSTNEASTFTAQTAWSLPNGIGYNHADVHGLFWINSTIYSISDGGIFKSVNAGDDWTDISVGLGIRQFYRFSNSPTNANVITGGAQDNGSATRQASGTWVDWLGADGMEGLVSPTNHLKLWGTSQNGSIYRSINGGNSYSGLPRPSPGDWVTPLWIHPTNENILYGGWTGVYKSTDGGSSWTNISPTAITTLVTDLAVAQSDPNYIYASRGSTLYVTTDDGATWATRSAPATINDICIDPTNPNKIWVALNSTTNRVMVSTDAGATFTNVSAGLPAIVARTVVVDDNTPRGMYVGMNIGVFYKLEPDANWTDFSDNLPLVAINELEIQKAAGKIRVATYGRGVWESPLAAIPPPSGFTFNNPAPAVATCPTPSTMNITLGTNVVGTFTNPITLTATAGVPGGTTISFGTNPVTPGNSSVITLNNANSLGAGSYIVTITGTATGATTQTRNITYTINGGSGPTVSTQPSNQNICVGNNATFTVAAAGATYQWQVSVDGGVTWNNIPTATAATLTVPAVTLAQNNTQYKAIATNTCGSTSSNVAILTVNPATTITSSPTSVTVCSGSSASFCVTASGNNLTYQWEVSQSCTAPFSNIAGANSSCLNITNALNTSVYRCKVTGSCGATVTSNCAQLTVGALATVTEQPTNKEICANGNTSFIVEGTSTFPITYQWQVSNDGGTTWNNISGATTSVLTLSNVSATANNNRYRCQLFTTACPTPANSNSAVLTVRALPTVGLSASPLTSLLPGQSTVLQATPSLPSSGSTISKTWIKDGAPFVYAGNLYAANVEKVGSYQVNISETHSSGLTCNSISPVVKLIAPRSDQLFIYPIPNDGRFTVSYYNVALTNSSRTITVFDAKGSKVYHKKMPINGAYTLLNVDIKPAQGGVYVVVVSDDKEKTLAQGKIIVK